MLSQLHHPHVIRHLDSFVEDDTLNILMEYASGGTIHHARQAGRMGESVVWKYCIQLLQAVAYIHSKRIIHRDIKTLNIFLDHLNNVKLGATLYRSSGHVHVGILFNSWAIKFRRFWDCTGVE